MGDAVDVACAPSTASRDLVVGELVGVLDLPETRKSHVARSTFGTPACSTGHFAVRYLPGAGAQGRSPLRPPSAPPCDRTRLPTLVCAGPGRRYGSAAAAGLRGVAGPGCRVYLQRSLSNDVEALAPGESCEALLLTAKGRLIAPMPVLRRGVNDFLSSRSRISPSGFRARAGAPLRGEKPRSSSRTTRPRSSSVRPRAPPNREYGVPRPGAARRRPAGRPIRHEELERLRIGARTPGSGRELDERVLPAEAGLDRAGHQLHEGLLPGPGAHRSAALPRTRQPLAAGPRPRPRDAPRRRRGAPTHGARRSVASRAPRHDPRRGPRARLRPGPRFPRTPSSTVGAARRSG